MAWIESHQTLGSHPKTRKAARALGLAPVHLMGHLHALWHWALDMADDGNLSKFDHDDIAIAAQWEGDPDLFVEALVSCGFGDGPGFLERGGTYGDPRDSLHGDLVLHDWWDYAGKLVARRMRDRERKAERREQDTATPSPGVPEEVQRTSSGSPEDVQRSAGNDLNRTEPNQEHLVELASPDPTLVEVPDPVVEVFDAWRTATGHTRSKLSPERRKLIRKWLKVGYTVEELIDACRGITRSKFHMGDNDRHTVYDDLKVVLKDAGNIDKFIGYERDGATIEEPTPWA